MKVDETTGKVAVESTTPDDPIQFNPFSLRFSSGYEKLYRENYFAESLYITRIALVLTSVLYSAFGLLDYLVATEFLREFFIIRFVIVVPVMLFTFLLSFTPQFRGVWQQMVFICVITGGIGISYMISRMPENSSYYGGLMLVFSAGYFFVRLRYMLASIAGWTILLVFNFIMISRASGDIYTLVSHNFFFVSANFIGTFVSYYLEKTSRTNFFLNQKLSQNKEELEQVNRNLENTVENRTRSLMESEQRFRNLVDDLPLIVYENDSQGNIKYVNKEAVRQMGFSRDEIYSEKNLLDFVVPEQKQIAAERLSTAHNRPGISSSEFMVLRKDGSSFPVLDYSIPIIENGQVSGMRSVVVDLTEQKSIEQLRTEVAVTRQSAEFKQNFLANMSHEIRTPLTGIIGITEILAGTYLDDVQKEYLNTLRQSTENLREIINQILDYSKIEAGKMVLKPVEFETAAIFDHAVRLFDHIRQKPVTLQTFIDPTIPVCIKVDIQRVQQIISNFLSNAIKFTPSGHIKLSATLKDKVREELKIQIDVEDTGIGISTEKQSMLFNPFTQIDHRDTRDFEGTGLGLSICRELSHILGGEIGVESRLGTGSRFWFSFSAKELANSEVRTKKIIKHNVGAFFRTLRILLVEDKKVNQKVIGLMLKSQGHIVTFASNGKDALETFEPGAFDLILMDIQMPVMDGITATENLRRKYKNLPLIVGLSANAFEGDREKYMARGMDDYLTKPVKGDDFRELISRWFKDL